MQLAGPTRPDPDVADLAAAVRDAHRVIGPGPAITVISPAGRQEQGMASLAQWAAKGAHLLEAELLLEPGERIALDAPLSWPSAAVCLAAWWAGIVVTLDGDADVTVIHEERLDPTPIDGDVLVLGDGIDGGPIERTAPEPWVRAVQAFPDHPPAPRAAADAIALRAGGRDLTHRDLLEQARSLSTDAGTIGIEVASANASSGAPDHRQGLIAMCIRPLVVGKPTVVLRGVDRSAADGEKVASWL